MPPPSQASTNFTSRATALPTQFKCAVGGEWKPASEFSQNQLKRWSQKKKHENDGVTAANIGLTCKLHTGGPQSSQIKCQGPCGIRKHREAFSKSQRNRPDAWCKQCTDWKERHPGDVIPGAAPNGDMSQDELYMRLSSIDDVLQHGRGEDDEDSYVAGENKASFFHGLDEDDADDNDGDDDDEDDDVDSALAGRFQSVTRSVFRATIAGDDRTDDDDDDARDYVLDDSIVGTQSRKLIGSLNVGPVKENLSDHGAAPSSKALGLPTGTGPCDSDMAPLPPNLRALNAGGSTATSTTASAAPHARCLNSSQSTAASSATGGARIRPELRGMTDPSPASNMPRRPKEPFSSTTSLDSRAGIESFASYTHVTTEDGSVQPSSLHDYNAFSPRGEMYVKTTGGASVTGKKPPITSTGRPIKVGPSGWLKGDNRKRFDAPPVFASMPEEQGGGYDSSGSEDEM
ncbi:hypothetical protein DL764_010932 [Monosporascus ibericus]|uniref:Stc1 domain-containing protein n=1 Tax=Monosporascus ibericus TaxID=155417 RepID=A0A4Q4STN5_9PEZI|nr:hypothetical protein DL764_010932 [Monosporascus ibericus]